MKIHAWLSSDVSIICDQDNNNNFYLKERRRTGKPLVIAGLTTQLLGLTQQEARKAVKFIQDNLEQD